MSFKDNKFLACADSNDVKDLGKHKKQQTVQKNIAVLIRGQLRTFCKKEVYSSFTGFLNKFESLGYNVVCFFAANKTSAVGCGLSSTVESMGAPETRGKKARIEAVDAAAAEINKPFDDLLKQSNIKYKCWGYGPDFAKSCAGSDIPKSHFLQMKLTERANDLMLDYELKNNIQFDYVVRTRPDLLYNTEQIIKSNLNFDRVIYWNWDFYRSYPRYIFNFYMEKVNDGSLINWMASNIRLTPNKKGTILHLNDLYLFARSGLNSFKKFPVKTHKKLLEQWRYRFIY